MTPAQLTGKSADHITCIEDLRCELHLGVKAAFLDMRAAAQAQGIDLVAASAYRTFERQLLIWNAKYTGERPVYDAAGVALDMRSLDPGARIEAIVRWSAVPGSSRHHWGTDLDLIDRNALPKGYQVHLIPAEFAAQGPFERLNDWLLRHAEGYGFFKPYCGIHSGVAPEPWHWSYADIAEAARAELTLEILQDALEDSAILGMDALRLRLRDLHAHFVMNIDPPRWLA